MHTTDDSQLLGHAIRAARRVAGITQEELALIAGVSRRSVIAVEQGKPTIRLDVLLALVRSLGRELQLAPRTLDAPTESP